MRAIAISIIAGLVSLIGPGALAADANNGAELARRWCAACHLITHNRLPMPLAASPFGSIAKRPGFNARQLSQALQAPHPRMPERGLSRDEAADIAAYIATLK
ncbi:MAG: c-type cytochrome [Xanthobacteraceae bacterium]|jgi:mono/diheme cytochrome c family protein|nr:c-type cytochrome [Xanthobacteraceae bacterium]